MKTLYALKRLSEDKLLKNNAVKLVMSETTGKQTKKTKHLILLSDFFASVLKLLSLNCIFNLETARCLWVPFFYYYAQYERMSIFINTFTLFKVEFARAVLSCCSIMVCIRLTSLCLFPHLLPKDTVKTKWCKYIAHGTCSILTIMIVFY